MTTAPEFSGYDPDLYVVRPQIESTIETWLVDPKPQKLIYSLIGPPGTGKSWVLAHFAAKNDLPCGMVYLIARDLLDIRNRDSIKRDLIRAANQSCPELGYPNDLHPSLEATVYSLTERMTQNCGAMFVLLVVDGLDDLDWGQHEEVQEILSKFFLGRTECFRMLIARRSSLTAYLLRTRDRPIAVGVFEAQPGIDPTNEQMQKLLQRKSIDSEIIDLESSLPEIRNYKWNHPFINACLLKRQLEKRPLTSDALESCCRALVNLSSVVLGDDARHPELDRNFLGLLLAIVRELPVHWSSTDFRRIAKRDLDVKDLRRGTIVNVKNDEGKPTPYYSIADGLRELLMDIAALQDMEVGR